MNSARIRVDFAAVRERAGEPQWRELPFGVRLFLRPLSGLTAAAIEGQLAADLAALAAGEDVIGRYGYDPADVGLLADAALSAGWSRMHLACVRGAALIQDWNLADAEDQPLPVIEANIQQLFQLGVAPGTGALLMQAFNRVVDQPLYEVAREKKGSAPSSTGDTGAGSSTAPAAEPQTPPAPAGAASKGSSALNESTPRTRRKASSRSKPAAEPAS